MGIGEVPDGRTGVSEREQSDSGMWADQILPSVSNGSFDLMKMVRAESPVLEPAQLEAGCLARGTLTINEAVDRMRGGEKLGVLRLLLWRDGVSSVARRRTRAGALRLDRRARWSDSLRWQQVRRNREAVESGQRALCKRRSKGQRLVCRWRGSCSMQWLPYDSTTINRPVRSLAAAGPTPLRPREPSSPRSACPPVVPAVARCVKRQTYE